MMSNVSLRTKLTLGFGALLAILVTMSTVDYLSIRRLGQLSITAETRADEAYLTRTIEALVNSRKVDIRSFLLTGNEEHMARYAEHNRGLTEEFAKLQPLMTTEEGKRLLAELDHAAIAYDNGALRVAELKRAGKMKAAVELLLGPELSSERAEMEKSGTALIGLSQNLRAATHQEETEGQSTAIKAVFGLGVLGFVVSLIVGTAVPRYFSGTITKIVGVIQEIAANNLAIEDIAVIHHDEMGQAGNALNKMKNNLCSLIQSIARSAEHVASASEEISSSATQQAQAAETQKGQATQVAVAMQEMSTTVNEVSENSSRAATASREAAETAREGGVIVEDAVAKMRAIAESVKTTAHKVQELGKSSDQIGRIIGVIDDIADQTNLLALNAAIEAARAGEQGRGFAVVADEVRKLAERTTSATKEVAQMVQSIQTETKTAVAAMHSGTTQVEEGVQTTTRAGDSLKQIIQMSEQVGEMIAHIATAATEQASATEQVNQNVEQITRLVNESSTSAQQSAKACQDLSGIALDLQKMVSNFNLGRGPGFAAGRLHNGPSAETQSRSTDIRAFAASAR
jgi:methyl-accepting chemotaxis protein